MRVKGKRLGFVSLVLIAALFAACLFLAAPRGARAYDKLPSDVFGERIGTVTLEDGRTCVNYERGYASYASGVTPAEDGTNALEHRSGVNIGADGEETRVAVEKMLEVVAKSGTVDNAGLRDTYGPGFHEAALSNIRAKISEKYRALYVGGYNPGVSLGIDAWDGVTIKEDFRYGDGLYGFDSASAGGRVNMTTIAYSVQADAAFAVTDEVWKKYSQQDVCRRLGSPVTDAGEFTLSGTTGSSATIEKKLYEGQIFETGALIKSPNGDYVEYDGALEKVDANEYVMYPWIDDQDIMARGDDGRISFIGNIDGIWHPLKTAFVGEITPAEEGGAVKAMYANFKGGCVKAEYDEEDRLVGAMRYAGYNFVKSETGYAREKLEIETFLSDEYLWEMKAEAPDGVEARALSTYRSLKADGTEESLKAAFQEAYADLYGQGFIAGYRASAIKVWDLIVLDFKFGDGKYGFDATGSGSRERMTVFVYSPTKDKAFPVYDRYFEVFRQDSGTGRKVLGAPTSGVEKNVTLAGTLFDEIQCFENGYIYRAGSEQYETRTGYHYDEENDAFLPVPAPDIPGNYGGKRAEWENNGKTYMNFEYGAVVAERNAFANGYVYEYYPARNFAEDGTSSMLDMSGFLSLDKLTGSFGTNTDMAEKFNSSIKNKIFAKYKALYDSGTFPGFMEGNFGGSWNSCYAQQFIHGDSTAKPFGEERSGVTALIYNPADGEVYYLTNAFMSLWAEGGENAKYTQLKVPTSDAYQKDGYFFQNFQGNQTGRSALAVVKGNANAYYFTDGTTAESYLDSVPDGKIPSHDGKYDDGYVGYDETAVSGGCGTIAPPTGGAGGTAGMILGLSALLTLSVFMLKKQCFKNKKQVS